LTPGNVLFLFFFLTRFGSNLHAVAQANAFRMTEVFDGTSEDRFEMDPSRLERAHCGRAFHGRRMASVVGSQSPTRLPQVCASVTDPD
jgi:hypothetical protein